MKEMDRIDRGSGGCRCWNNCGTAMAAVPQSAGHSRAAVVAPDAASRTAGTNSPSEATQGNASTPAPGATQPADVNHIASCRTTMKTARLTAWRYGAGGNANGKQWMPVSTVRIAPAIVCDTIW